MVFMVRLTSGSLLLLLLCIVQASNTTESTSTENPQTLSIERSIETKSELKNLNKLNVSKYNDEDVENKVYPFKFSSTKPESATSIKLKKSESYTSTPESNNGSSRLDSGRSVDIDIEKFISPDFYNAVYTPPISTKDQTSGYETSQYGTEKFGQLTTPSTPFFDKKYKELVDSVNQKLEVDTDVETLTHPPNYTSDNFVEDLAKNPNGTKIVYKIFENIGVNKTSKSGGVHKDVVLETQTILNIEQKLNETTTYDEKTASDGINQVHKENLKYLLGDEHANEVKKEEGTISSSPSLRTSFQLTTKKYSITKPSTDKNDAGIISNKIESDTLKSLITTTTSSSVPKHTNLEKQTMEVTERNTNQVIDNQQETSSTVSTSVKVPELVYQENQIIPVHISSSSTTLPTTIRPSDPEEVKVTSAMNKEEETTMKNENISVRNNTVEPEEQQSTTVLIIVQPDEQKKSTTEKYFAREKPVTIASTPRGFSLPVSYTEKATTESQTTVKTAGPITLTEFEDLITTIKESTTLKNINDIIGGKNTEDGTTKDATTVDIETLEPTITKSSFTKYIISDSTDIPSTVELPTTLFLKTDESSSTNAADINIEISSNVMDIDEVLTTPLPLETTQKLDQTTASSSSSDVIVAKESSVPTEFTESSTHQVSSESTSAIATNEYTPSAFTETTTFAEQEVTTDFLPKFSTEINTEPPTTQTSIDTSTSDGGGTTEIPPKTTFTLEQTTSNDLRFSKGMRFTQESSMVTEIMKDSTAGTDIETTTSIQSESTQSVTKKDTIPAVEETTAAKEQGTTIEITTESPLKITVTNITEATSTAILSSFQASSNSTLQHEQSTENSGVNLTTLRLNKLYVTELPVSSGTSNEPITADGNGHSSELEGGSGTIVAIVISCVGGVCLVALACLLVVMRNRQKRFNYGQRCKPVSMDQYSVDSVSVFSSVRRKGVIRHSKRSYGNPAFEDPVCLSHPLNFPAISKFAANTEDVEAEFGDIPQIVARTSELPEGCETKNRFANVIPLPESRVFLTPMAGYPNSDYINANYVTGPKNTRKYYIACQAPMSNTVDDFWRMIWEQQCKVILMLTHLFENGAERCFDYLPPSEVLDCHRLFGDYQVTLKKREVKEKYIISSLQLKNMVSNSWREVTHFWYMGWPEKGVPLEANSIIAFLIEARSFMKSATMDKQVVLKPDVNGTCSPEVNPVVVHCSPGTGRTGTAITCDIAIREFEQTRQVDIPKIVYRIRRDRASAVQTKEQYAFIYKVIALYATKLAGGSLESI